MTETVFSHTFYLQINTLEIFSEASLNHLASMIELYMLVEKLSLTQPDGANIKVRKKFS